MDDLVNEFITETSDGLAVLDSELLKLEQNPGDTAILGNIFRVMHTIKGTCGFLGLPRLESVAHASENVLGKIRDKEITATPEAVTLILESLDVIKGLVEYLAANAGTEQPGDDKELIVRLNHFADTGTIAGSAPAAATPAPAESNGAAEPFPHFKGDDDPEMEAAIKALMAKQNVTDLNDLKVTPTFDEDPPVKKAAAPAPTPAPAPVIATPAPAPAPVAKAAPAGEHGEASSGTKESIRVNIEVLESLMQMVSELVLTRNQLMQIARTKEDKDFMTPLQQLSHITSELQDGVMKTRMQPIGNAWSKVPRLIRDLSNDLGKKIDLKMIGAETELDRQLLEVIKDPLTHMVRNSCDHGLESPADRLAAGKPEVGTVTLSAFHEGGHIVIVISDDGRGINIERVKQKAIANGIATEEQLETMSEKQIAMFVFAAGFSTAEKVTSVSGRGVGMDVVRTNIEKIGGTIDLDSTWGKGSQVSIKIPLTLAIVSVLLVEVCGQKFAIPQINVMELVRVSPTSELSLETINDSPVLRLRNKLLPLAILSEILGFPVNRKELLTKESFIAVCRMGDTDFGIIVDRVYDTEEIVVKPVAGILKDISIYSGNTTLGDGSVIMILDPSGIVKTLGEMEIGDKADTGLAEKGAAERESLIGFLLFSSGKGAPKAVPLELVSRLEEIEISAIEVAGEDPVVQYRGDLMRLIMLEGDASLPTSGVTDVIVFNYDKKVIGLVVSEILDIVYTPFAIKLTTKDAKNQGYLGSMVISGKSTDVVDVAHLLSDVIGEQVAENSDNKAKAQDCSLLLVEDSPFFRNLTIPFLASAGYKVTATESAEEAMDILNSGKYMFNMIVTDLEMPGMNGFEFATACRKLPSVHGTPIVAYTSSMSDEVVKKSKLAGMDDCIVKTDRPGLLQSIAHCLSVIPTAVRH